MPSEVPSEVPSVVPSEVPSEVPSVAMEAWKQGPLIRADAVVRGSCCIIRVDLVGIVAFRRRSRDLIVKSVAVW